MGGKNFLPVILVCYVEKLYYCNRKKNVLVFKLERMGKVKELLLILLALFCSCQNKDRSAVSVTETEGMADSMWLPLDSISVDKDAIFTCVSEDGVMKFYSWNTGQGGTCPDYAVICQFRTKDGKIVTEDFRDKEDMPAWVSAVHSIQKNDGTTYYITTRSHRASSNDGYGWMDGFMIDNDTLRNVSVFEGGDDLDECVLEINYRISEWDDITNGEGWNWLFEYDAESRNLYVPQAVFVDETIPTISDRYRVYHFNGEEFVYKGESAHKGLHQSLRNYYRLASYFRTMNYLVRIDLVDYEGTLRFASWKSTTDMSKQPNMTIFGGKYDEENDTYTFFNDGYEYVVGYSEDIPESEDMYDHHEFLLVKKEGKVVFKEERVNPYDE